MMPLHEEGSSPRYLAGSHWLHFLQGTSPCPGSHLYRPEGEGEGGHSGEGRIEEKREGKEKKKVLVLNQVYNLNLQFIGSK